MGMVVCLSILALRKSDDLSKVYPASSLIVAGIGSSPPATLKRIRGRELMDGWMDGFKNLQYKKRAEIN